MKNYFLKNNKQQSVHEGKNKTKHNEKKKYFCPFV